MISDLQNCDTDSLRDQLFLLNIVINDENNLYLILQKGIMKCENEKRTVCVFCEKRTLPHHHHDHDHDHHQHRILEFTSSAANLIVGQDALMHERSLES